MKVNKTYQKWRAIVYLKIISPRRQENQGLFFPCLITQFICVSKGIIGANDQILLLHKFRQFVSILKRQFFKERNLWIIPVNFKQYRSFWKGFHLTSTLKKRKKAAIISTDDFWHCFPWWFCFLTHSREFPSWF